MLSVITGIVWFVMIVACIAAELTQVRSKAALGVPYSILMAFVRIIGDAGLTLILMTIVWAFFTNLVAFIITAVVFGGYTRHRIGEVLHNMAIEHQANEARHGRFV